MKKAHKFDLENPAPILDDEDEQTLAAIDEGIRDADACRIVPAEKVRENWLAIALRMQGDARAGWPSNGNVCKRFLPSVNEAKLQHRRSEATRPFFFSDRPRRDDERAELRSYRHPGKRKTTDNLHAQAKIFAVFHGFHVPNAGLRKTVEY